MSTGAVGYYETSALTSSGVSDAMMAALRAVLSATGSRPSRRKFTWPWKRYITILKKKTDFCSRNIPLPTRMIQICRKHAVIPSSRSYATLTILGYLHMHVFRGKELSRYPLSYR